MALEGHLSDMSLSDLFQVFRGGRKHGQRVLEHQTRVTVIWFADGRCVDATIHDQAAPDRITRGDAAVLEVFQWPGAPFIFLALTADDRLQTTISHPTDWLILEGLRRRARHDLDLYDGLTLDSRLELVPSLHDESDQVSFNLDAWHMLSCLCDAIRVSELVQRMGYSSAQTLAIAARLVALGVVRAEPPPILPPSPPIPALAGSSADPPRPRSNMLTIVQAIKTRLRRITSSEPTV